VNVRELQVLEALNIASTIHRRPGHDFEATAAQVADRYFHDTGIRVSNARMAAWLRELRRLHPWDSRREPLVEPVYPKRWRLTSHACHLMLA
jgi:hypothetical protein